MKLNIFKLTLRLSAITLAMIVLVSVSGCSSSTENSVIAPTENFQEDPAVAAEKEKAKAASQAEPL